LQLYRPAGDATHEDATAGDVWVDVAIGKNSYVVTFSPVLSAALGCNTVRILSLALYFKFDAKSCCRTLSLLVPCVRASQLGLFGICFFQICLNLVTFSFYLVKYLAKDGNELANILSLVKAADEQIRRHPSVADDSGTETRRSQHLLTRLLNCVNGQVEVGGQTAALALLGLPSNIMSHGFVFVYIRAAVEYVKSAHASQPPAPATVIPRQTLQETLEIDPIDDQELFVDENNDQDDNNDDDGGACDVTRTGAVIALVPQHLDYAHRGEKLRKLSYFQWCGIVCVADKRSRRVLGNREESDSDRDGDDGSDVEVGDSGVVADAEEGAQATTAQRRLNKVFPFSMAHVARANKTQRLHSKQLVCDLISWIDMMSSLSRFRSWLAQARHDFLEDIKTMLFGILKPTDLQPFALLCTDRGIWRRWLQTFR